MHEFVSKDILVAIVRYAKRAPQDNLVCMAQGNISGRDPDTGYIAITPHELPYHELEVADLVILNSNGDKTSGENDPSFETPVHVTVYRARPEVMGIVHSEPPFVNAFGAVNREIMPITTTLFKSAGGIIPVMPYMRSGSWEFADKMIELMGDMNAVVWANHGMIVVGTSVELAYNRSIAIEQGASTFFRALQIGKPNVLVDFSTTVEI